MEKHEIENLREKVTCAIVLEAAGWKVDLKESTRRALKFRRGDGEIIIVIHEGRGWFDPLSTKKGDIFDLAEHLGADGFVAACEHLASLVGVVSSEPVWTRPARPSPAVAIAERWQRRFKPRPGSATWRYLTSERALPHDVVQTAIAQDCLREGPHGSMWAVHRSAPGEPTGWEERGPAWRGFATEGAKVLFRFGARDADRICVTEAAIDAMSLAAIEVLRRDTLYVSTGGGWSPATDEALRHVAMAGNVSLVAATDNNRQGDIYAERIQAIAAESGASYVRSRPRGDDWNEDLKVLMTRLSRPELVAFA
ncbi:DUF3991 and toprim domain-containing protein [Rhizobium multihospitium]|uniref:DUF3991 domain-containing protein n=1 Tax=Rhizobium multihospitium TaxID=410764 RepID=A0A1C3XCL7_9HYPH|nr:DUF3991 and toprim domain-containing protein [Rhizobium multihospitium]SCB50040.1 Protein of unknown function [Rhizobium multihospitium]